MYRKQNQIDVLGNMSALRTFQDCVTKYVLSMCLSGEWDTFSLTRPGDHTDAGGVLLQRRRVLAGSEILTGLIYPSYR